MVRVFLISALIVLKKQLCDIFKHWVKKYTHGDTRSLYNEKVQDSTESSHVHLGALVSSQSPKTWRSGQLAPVESVRERVNGCSCLCYL